MNHKRMGFIRMACFALACIAGSGAAWAQSDYPNKPVKIIVPFPPGGTSDVMARMVADELTRILKQPFVVDNVGGAGGVERPQTEPLLVQRLPVDQPNGSQRQACEAPKPPSVLHGRGRTRPVTAKCAHRFALLGKIRSAG